MPTDLLSAADQRALYLRKFKDEDKTQIAMLGWWQAQRRGITGYAAYRTGVWKVLASLQASKRIKRSATICEFDAARVPDPATASGLQKLEAGELLDRVLHTIECLNPNQQLALRCSLENHGTVYGAGLPQKAAAQLGTARMNVRKLMFL